MSTKRAYLEYLGNRKWRKIKNSKITLGKSYLRYTGERKWKKQRQSLLKH